MYNCGEFKPTIHIFSYAKVNQSYKWLHLQQQENYCMRYVLFNNKKKEIQRQLEVLDRTLQLSSITIRHTASIKHGDSVDVKSPKKFWIKLWKPVFLKLKKKEFFHTLNIHVNMNGHVQLTWNGWLNEKPGSSSVPISHCSNTMPNYLCWGHYLGPLNNWGLLC